MESYRDHYAPLLGLSLPMGAVRDIVEKVAETNAAVLILGESGVGKDIVARAIHAASPRSAGAYVKVNCAALPAELLESELFGHERGAFTGAYRRKLGRFELADRGTIFLDEIGEIPPSLQAKLLHVLQDMEFPRVGGREIIRVDVRVIASTNRDLETAMSRGQFREDLYYRLNVVEIRVPPLRQRPVEIGVLAGIFLKNFNHHYERAADLDPATLALLSQYAWPGNVRELENLMRRLAVLGDPAQVQAEIHARMRATQKRLATSPAEAEPEPPPAVRPTEELGLREIARRAARDAEREVVKEVLDRVQWNRLAASRILRIGYKTLLRKMANCGLSGTNDLGRP